MNPNTHFENVKSTVDYNVARYLGVLRDRPDRSEWITPASVVNAFYSPEHNSICKTPFCFLFYDNKNRLCSKTCGIDNISTYCNRKEPIKTLLHIYSEISP